MITAIESNEEIRDALFPGVGGIKLTGGLPKTHHYYQLAIICFADHVDYKTIFDINPELRQALQTKQRKMWTEKIKNKVAS